MKKRVNVNSLKTLDISKIKNTSKKEAPDNVITRMYKNLDTLYDRVGMEVDVINELKEIYQDEEYDSETKQVEKNSKKLSNKNNNNLNNKLTNNKKTVTKRKNIVIE